MNAARHCRTGAQGVQPDSDGGNQGPEIVEKGHETLYCGHTTATEQKHENPCGLICFVSFSALCSLAVGTMMAQFNGEAAVLLVERAVDGNESNPLAQGRVDTIP